MASGNRVPAAVKCDHHNLAGEETGLARGDLDVSLPFVQFYQGSEAVFRKGRLVQKAQVRFQLGHVDAMVDGSRRDSPLMVLSDSQGTGLTRRPQHRIKGGGHACGEGCPRKYRTCPPAHPPLRGR